MKQFAADKSLEHAMEFQQSIQGLSHAFALPSVLTDYASQLLDANQLLTVRCLHFIRDQIM
jgi:hypothetical protein